MFRNRSINPVSYTHLVQTQFGQEMEETSLYLFCGRRADRIKALYWDGTGYILLYRRLTEKRFQWPRSEKDLKKLTLQEFRWLMEGLSITCLLYTSRCV